MRAWGGVLLALMLAACGGRVVPPPATHYPSPRYPQQPARRPTPATPLPPVDAPTAPGAISAVNAGVTAGPPLYSLPIDDRQAANALAAFRTSCPALLRRTDTSGLTRSADWQPACDAARDAPDARAFFVQWFEAAQIGDGKAFATGYFIPEIAGSRDHRPGYDVPVYGRPPDLVDVDLGQFSADLKGKKIRGRVNGNNFVPYYDRGAIEQGAIAARAPVIAWAADPVEMFFLEVQGSGILRLPDGGTMRIGYESQNGRDYTGIGALMKSRGLLGPGQTSMQGIVQYLHDHPDEGRDIMRENKSFIFFRELTGSPLGALNIPVTGGVSAAVDVRFVPLGAPVFLSMDRADASRLWIAQDTGGAIKGANRVDTFWGAGDDARATAGGMAAHGTAFLLLPTGTLARLAAEGRGGGTTPRP